MKSIKQTNYEIKNYSTFNFLFNLADNYTIHNNTMELNVGRRAPLARFAAVYC
ncbi:MAG: hypothetical protein ACOH2V_14040 [Candidatus Saccharimonadaceae bacterium]